MIRCACLLDVRNDAILLVRVRDNDLWYLPGGTIEQGETEKETLIREIDEELGVQLEDCSICFDRAVTGPALGRAGDVELNCFRAKWDGVIQARSEISEVEYLPIDRLNKFAPAVRILVQKLQIEGAIA